MRAQTAPFTLNADIFYNDYDHYIGQNSLAPNAITHVGFVAINLNSGMCRARGAEVEAVQRLADRWEFQANLTAMHARITDGNEYVQDHPEWRCRRTGFCFCRTGTPMSPVPTNQPLGQ